MRLYEHKAVAGRSGTIHALVGLLLSLVWMVGAAAPNDKSCRRVDAYWNTNFNKLMDNISGCTDDRLWHKCSLAAAIHYDLDSGSLGQRARSCGLQKPALPGDDYTTPHATDSSSCLGAREQLRSAFEMRALARLACAAARAGGDDQEWLDAQCISYRSQLSSYHAPFRDVEKFCELDYEQQVATIDQQPIAMSGWTVIRRIIGPE